MVDSTESVPNPNVHVGGPPRRRAGLVVLLLVIALVLSLAVIAVLVTKVGTGSAEERTVTVTGQATLQEIPDQYVFSPSYTFQNEDKAAALAAMTKRSDELVAGLKKLSVADDAIKTNSDSYDMPVELKSQLTYNLRLTITVKDKDLAQKVQDYLVSTTPSGGVSPSVSFSDAKRKTVENKARDEATKDARSKADQSAKNLGFKVSKVKTVTDSAGFNGVIPYATTEGRAVAPAADAAQPSTPQLSLQPGQNDITYSVTVVYEIN
jgi:uncharacterized protein